MPNTIGTSGLTIKTASEIVADLTAEMQAIFGADINVDSNSPDGQLINIFAQASVDNLELLQDVYNSFTVPNSYGVLLDQRVALNGLTRKQGTYTQARVNITVSQSLTLVGQDTGTADQIFTVADNTGNKYQLKATVSLTAGTTTQVFQAVDIGLVETTPNTITNQVTTVLGVTAVNNPSTASDVIGVNEESDAELKVRQANSFELAAVGPADTVEAALQAIADVTDAYVIENSTNGTVNGTGAHSIWCIVTGGTAAEIAQAIYTKKGIGCGMRGAVSHTVTRPNGNGFVALWDVSIAQPLYLQFTIQGIVAGAVFDTTFIKAQLEEALRFKLGQSPNIGNIIAAMLIISPNGYLTNVGVSTDGITYTQVVAPTGSQYYFTVSTAHMAVTTA